MRKDKLKSAIVKIDLPKRPFDGKNFEPTLINFLYGKNGTGKTSISRTIADDETLTWNPKENRDDYDILVFNHDFIDRNLQQHDNMPGVFTISEEDLKSKKEAEEKVAKKAEVDATAVAYGKEIREKQDSVQRKKDEFTKDCWNISKSSRDFFKNSMAGYRSDSKGLAAFILSGVTFDGVRLQPLEHDADQLRKLYETAYDSNAKAYPEIKPVRTDILPECPLMGEIITNSGDTPFANFIKSINATSWVRQGHEQFHKAAGELCPYCRQKLPDGFEQELAACFDENYTRSIREISEFKVRYQREAASLMDHLKSIVGDNPLQFPLGEYYDALSEAEKTISENVAAITQKEKDPATAITIKGLSPVLEAVNDQIERFNAIIRENNEAVREKDKKQSECKTMVWEALLFELDESIKEYRDFVTKTEAEVKELDDKFKKAESESLILKNEIARLTMTNSNTQAAVVSINSRLKDAGFQGFYIREKQDNPNVYEVVREEGKPAVNLSEGEVNFIAFLYFYHLVYGSDKAQSVSKKKVVVIDDPVSSIDSDVMFIVGAFVRDLIEVCRNNLDLDKQGKDDFIKQIFILTHNTYFHQEVSYREEQNWEYVSFFLVSKENNEAFVDLSTIPSPYGSDMRMNYNPVKNSYAALWDEYDEVKSPIALLGVMRRILEYYFMQICRFDSKELYDKILKENGGNFIDTMPDGKEDRGKYNQAKAMLSYLAVNRIGITDGLNYIDDLADMDMFKKTFEMIFECMGQGEHYRKMTSKK